VTTNKSQLQELIQADLDGELSATERADLARLLLQDPEARRLQNEFRKTDRLLRDIAAAEPPPDLRAAILVGSAQSVRPDSAGRQQYGWPVYRMAAVIIGGLLIVGVSYLVRDGNAPAKNLQGSLIASQDQLSMRAEGAEVNASLKRDGERLRLELNMSTTVPSEIVARIDPAATTLVGSSGDAQLNSADGEITVQPAVGSQSVVLEFSGAAAIQLELRSGGRLLGEGRLSVSDR
jgi:anti-sigma factor RsiW